MRGGEGCLNPHAWGMPAMRQDVAEPAACDVPARPWACGAARPAQCRHAPGASADPAPPRPQWPGMDAPPQPAQQDAERSAAIVGGPGSAAVSRPPARRVDPCRLRALRHPAPRSRMPSAWLSGPVRTPWRTGGLPCSAEDGETAFQPCAYLGRAAVGLSQSRSPYLPCFACRPGVGAIAARPSLHR